MSSPAISEETGILRHRLALEGVMQRTDMPVVPIGATRPEPLDNAVAAQPTGILARLTPCTRN